MLSFWSREALSQSCSGRVFDPGCTEPAECRGRSGGTQDSVQALAESGLIGRKRNAAESNITELDETGMDLQNLLNVLDVCR